MLPLIAPPAAPNPPNDLNSSPLRLIGFYLQFQDFRLQLGQVEKCNIAAAKLRAPYALNWDRSDLMSSFVLVSHNSPT